MQYMTLSAIELNIPKKDNTNIFIFSFLTKINASFFIFFYKDKNIFYKVKIINDFQFLWLLLFKFLELLKMISTKKLTTQ